jgi:hypothetical protein
MLDGQPRKSRHTTLGCNVRWSPLQDDFSYVVGPIGIEQKGFPYLKTGASTHSAVLLSRARVRVKERSTTIDCQALTARSDGQQNLHSFYSNLT